MTKSSLKGSPLDVQGKGNHNVGENSNSNANQAGGTVTRGSIVHPRVRP